MKKTKPKVKKPKYSLENCGSRKKGGCSWAGASKGETNIKIAA